MALGIFKKAWNTTQLDDLTNYLTSAISGSKAYCVFSDWSSEAVTSITGLDSVISCNLFSSPSYNGINSGEFLAVTNGIRYTGGETIDVIINVVLSGTDESFNRNSALFGIYINGGAVDSSVVISTIEGNSFGTSFPMMCGTVISTNDEIKIYARIANEQNFNFGLKSINISITQV
jgi:hypothetical protein